MKTRTGFVSNSSSSSFILILDTATQESFYSLFGDNHSSNLLNQIYRDLDDGVLLSEENLSKVNKILEMAENGEYGYVGIPNDFMNALEQYYDGQRDWASLEQELVSQEARDLVAKFPGKVAFYLSYSDNEDQGDLEHGAHWYSAGDRVLRFSHH